MVKFTPRSANNGSPGMLVIIDGYSAFHLTKEGLPLNLFCRVNSADLRRIADELEKLEKPSKD